MVFCHKFTLYMLPPLFKQHLTTGITDVRGLVVWDFSLCSREFNIPSPHLVSSSYIFPCPPEDQLQSHSALGGGQKVSC